MVGIDILDIGYMELNSLTRIGQPKAMRSGIGHIQHIHSHTAKFLTRVLNTVECAHLHKQMQKYICKIHIESHFDLRISRELNERKNNDEAAM